MPAIGKILVIFVSMLLLTRIRVPLGIALVAGGICLDTWSGRGSRLVAEDLFAAGTSGETWLLLVVIVLVIEFARYLTREENAEVLVGAIRRWGGSHGAATSLMALPAVIGLLPMPAGALLSAPLVEHAGRGEIASAEWKTAVNYWFRHIWEYWWPLYPGVIVAMSVFEMETWQFASAQIWFTGVCIAAGYVFLIRPHVGSKPAPGDARPASTRRVAVLMLPLAIVVACTIFLSMLLGKLLPDIDLRFRKMLPMLLGLFIGALIIVRDEKRSGGIRFFSALRKAKSWSVVLTIGGVMVFKSFLASSQLIGVACREMVSSGIPIVIAVAGLPFLAGVVAGIAVGFTGISFPLVVGLMAAEGSGLHPVSTLVLAYAFGYMGMMFSPLHLCLVMSAEYFKASVARVLWKLAPCGVCILAFAVAAHILLRYLQY